MKCTAMRKHRRAREEGKGEERRERGNLKVESWIWKTRDEMKREVRSREREEGTEKGSQMFLNTANLHSNK